MRSHDCRSSKVDLLERIAMVSPKRKCRMDLCCMVPETDEHQETYQEVVPRYALSATNCQWWAYERNDVWEEVGIGVVHLWVVDDF